MIRRHARLTLRRWTDEKRKSETGVKEAVETLYPDRPKPALPMHLPIEEYAGTYYHPGYQNITLEVVDSSTPTQRPSIRLKATRADQVLASSYEFEHVSGEYWVVYYYLIQTPHGSIEFGPVEFHIGPNGKVVSMGLELGSKPKGQGEGWILFKKVA